MVTKATQQFYIPYLNDVFMSLLMQLGVIVEKVAKITMQVKSTATHKKDPDGSPTQSESPHSCSCLCCFVVPAHPPHLLVLNLPDANISETVWIFIRVQLKTTSSVFFFFLLPFPKHEL